MREIKIDSRANLCIIINGSHSESERLTLMERHDTIRSFAKTRRIVQAIQKGGNNGGKRLLRQMQS